MARQITIPATLAMEDIIAITEYPGKYLRVCVAVVNPDGAIANPNKVEDYVIDGNHFTELMSANPEWAPGKPAGTYRNEDLWRFIDILRSAS